MKDKEMRESDALENLIQAAYDFSDEQLLAELEEAEATLSDSDFPGIEDRMYQKLRARMAEEEAAETPTAQPAEAGEKVVRFRKKKVLVVGILAAAFVGMLGVTAIGEKNYFFKAFQKQQGIIIDTDRNLQYTGSLDDAYKKIEEILCIPVLKLKYIPEDMELIQLDINDSKAIMVFKYKEQIIYYIQEQLSREASVGINSDRNLIDEKIYNFWLAEYFDVSEENLDEGVDGYDASLNIDNVRYRIFGKIPKEEIKKIVENLNY